MVKERVEKEIEEVEKYEYLLVKYLREISNQTTYLLLMMATLFLFVVIDVSPAMASYDTTMVRLVVFVVIIGFFGLFGISSMIKRKIEKKFDRILH